MTHSKKLARGDIIFSIVNYTIFALFTLICVYPFYYLIINTISANDFERQRVHQLHSSANPLSELH